MGGIISRCCEETYTLWNFAHRREGRPVPEWWRLCEQRAPDSPLLYAALLREDEAELRRWYL